MDFKQTQVKTENRRSFTRMKLQKGKDRETVGLIAGVNPDLHGFARGFTWDELIMCTCKVGFGSSGHMG